MILCCPVSHCVIRCGPHFCYHTITTDLAGTFLSGWLLQELLWPTWTCQRMAWRATPWRWGNLWERAPALQFAFAHSNQFEGPADGSPASTLPVVPHDICCTGRTEIQLLSRPGSACGDLMLDGAGVVVQYCVSCWWLLQCLLTPPSYLHAHMCCGIPQHSAGLCMLYLLTSSSMSHRLLTAATCNNDLRCLCRPTPSKLGCQQEPRGLGHVQQQD